jgi:hypothetical protein
MELTGIQRVFGWGESIIMPPLARWLGYAGLLPQAFAVGWLAVAPKVVAVNLPLLLVHGYAALIFSFLGGLWWGLGAAARDRAPAWVWVAAVVPSLVGLGSMALMVMTGMNMLALALLGIGLVAALVVDRQLVALDIAPASWMDLRTPLSLGLGGLTLVAAALS